MKTLLGMFLLCLSLTAMGEDFFQGGGFGGGFGNGGGFGGGGGFRRPTRVDPSWKHLTKAYKGEAQLGRWTHDYRDGLDLYLSYNKDVSFGSEPAKTPWLIYLNKANGPCEACKDLAGNLKNPKIQEALKGYVMTWIESDTNQYRSVTEWLRTRGDIDHGEEAAPLIVIIDGLNTRVVLGGMPEDNFWQFLRDEKVIRPAGCTYRAPHKGDPGYKELR